MLFIESIIKNNDNSGIHTGKIIHIYPHGHKQTPAKIKQLILIAAQKTDFRKIPKKKITKGLIVKLKKNIKRKNGHYLHFSKSGFLPLYDNNLFKGTIIRGPIAAEIRFQPIPEISLTAKAMI